MHSQIDELRILYISSQKQLAYVPPPLRREGGSEGSGQNIRVDDEQEVQSIGKALRSVDICQIYQDIQTAFHGDQKVNLS